jgi:thioredoxin reductase
LAAVLPFPRRERVLLEMPVWSATSVMVIARCSRSRRSRGATSSSVASTETGASIRRSNAEFPKTATTLARTMADGQPRSMNTYDVVVIGGGASGLSAALVLARARRTIAVIDAGQPRNAPAARMQGFLSRDGLAPSELIAAGRAEIDGYGAKQITGAVTDVYRTDSGFRIERADGAPLSARRVLVATGLRDEIPDVPGVRERWGRDLLHCPYCHGFEVRDQPLGVLGGTPNAVEHALLVRQWSADVIYFPHTDVLTEDDSERLAARSIAVAAGTVARLLIRDDRLFGVELDDGAVVRRTAVFVRPHMVPSSDLLTTLGADTNSHGWVTVDNSGRTSVPGVYAAGNAVNPRAQVITAAGEGSAAAIAINADLVGDDVAAAVLMARALETKENNQ